MFYYIYTQSLISRLYILHDRNLLSSHTCVHLWVNCFLDIDDCEPNPCANGGLCTDGVNSYTCSCAIGYMGPNCNTSKYTFIIFHFRYIQINYSSNVRIYFKTMKIDILRYNLCNKYGRRYNITL